MYFKASLTALLTLLIAVSVLPANYANAGELNEIFFDGEAESGSWYRGDQVTEFKYGGYSWLTDVPLDPVTVLWQPLVRHVDHNGEVTASAWGSCCDTQLYIPNQVGYVDCGYRIAGADPGGESRHLTCMFFRYGPDEEGPGDGDFDLFPPGDGSAGDLVMYYNDEN